MPSQPCIVMASFKTTAAKIVAVAGSAKIKVEATLGLIPFNPFA